MKMLQLACVCFAMGASASFADDYNSGYNSGATPGAAPGPVYNASPTYQSGYDAGMINNEMEFERQQEQQRQGCSFVL